MECWETQTYVDSLLDNEIDPATRVLVEDHLTTCTQCHRIFESQQQIKQFLKAQMKHMQAPDTLRQRIIAQIDQLEREERQRESIWQRYFQPKIWVPAVVGLLLLGAFLWMADLFAPPALVQEVINDHARSLTQRPIEGLYNTDAATVRQWLSTQLAFSVPVPDIQGLTLVGGRIETVRGQKAANILYRKEHDIFSLFILPDRGESIPFPTNRQVGTRSIYVDQTQGYTAVLWQDKDIYCAFVGHLPEKEVLEYALKAMRI